MAYENITLERDGDLAVLTLNRPEVRNAINEGISNLPLNLCTHSPMAIATAT